MFYKGRLTTTLQAAVDESLGLTGTEQISLYEELALVRHGAGLAVQQYGEALELLELSEKNKAVVGEDAVKKAKAVVNEAADAMLNQLKRVEYFCSAIARIEAATKDKVTIHTLNGVVKQMVRLMYQTCGTDNQHLAEQFEALTREKIVLPASENQVTGTSITPDADVLAMDDTVPGPPLQTQA